MDVVVAGAVGNLEHYTAIGLSFFDGITAYPADDGGIVVSVGIILRRTHEALGVVGVVERPVVHATAGNAVMEVVRGRGYQEGGHGAAKAEALYANLVSLHIGQALQPLGPLHKVVYLNGTQFLVDSIQALSAVVACSSAVCNEFDDAVLRIPVVAGGMAPAVKHLRGVGAAVNVHVDGILLGRVKALGIVDDAGQFQPVYGYGNYLSGTALVSALAGNELGMALEVVQTDLPRRLKVGGLGNKMLAVRSKGGVQNV